MTEKAIWVTVEGPIEAGEYDQIAQAFQDTDLSDRYEIIITEDRIDTLDMDELRELMEQISGFESD